MAKESRLAEIYRQELKTKGLLGAYMSAANERRKEKYDIRNILPQSGLTGAAFQKVFGRAYRYSANKGASSSTVRDMSGGIDTKPMVEKLTRIGLDTKISAKNSIVLPGMASDMNIMRQNMQQMVRITSKGKTKPAKGADALFKRVGDRNSIYDRLTKSTEEVKPGVGSSGLLGGIGSMIGGVASGMGSVISGIISAVGSVGGGILSSLGKLFGGLGIVGVVAFAGIAWLVSQLFTNVDFSTIGGTFGDLFKSIGDVGKKFLELFTGNKEGESFDDRWKKFKNSIGEVELEVTKVKTEFKKMVEAISMNVSNLKDLYNDLGGGLGILGMLLGARVAGGIAASWVPALVGAAATPAGLVAALLGGTAYGLWKLNESVANRPDDRNVPLTPQEQADSQTAATNNNMHPTIVAARKREAAKKLEAAQASLAAQEQKRAELQAMLDNPNDKTNKELVRTNIEGVNKTIADLKSRNPGLNRTAPSISSPDTTDDNRRGRGYVLPTQPQKVSNATLSKTQESMAKLIYNRFIEAGFTDEQAKGAVANARAESALNPNAYNGSRGEESVGLFQLNRKGKGLGRNHSVEQLKDPNLNIDLAIAEAKKSEKFIKARTAEEATRGFMLEVERPKDQSESAQQKRIALLGPAPTRLLGDIRTGEIINLASSSNAVQNEPVTPIVNFNMPQPQIAQADRSKQELSSMNPEALLLFLVNAVTDPA